MLIRKNGICREISEQNLHKYTAKGYEVVEEKLPEKKGKATKEKTEE